jgi:general transcription factor 3C polypeptide 1
MAKESNDLFYNRKVLERYRIITRQPFCQKNKNGIIVSGMIFHLPRYFTEMKPKMCILIEKVVNELKTRTNCMAEYEEIRDVITWKHEKSAKWFRFVVQTNYIFSESRASFPYI